ncbi:MAG: OmpA family protein [Rickettsiales bacterium]|jgi:outer membrane protein OmpA-like peptidoglycan-associated protein|nr:OmpA family protein [Rickettsiales bacterium]
MKIFGKIILFVLFLAPMAAMADAAGDLTAAYAKYEDAIKNAKTILASKIKPNEADALATKDLENATKANATATDKLAKINNGLEVDVTENVDNETIPTETDTDDDGDADGTPQDSTGEDGDSTTGENNKSGIQPKLSEEDSQKKVDELKANAQAMKDKENSTANKTVSAAAMGAAGIGAMNLMSGMAEKNADEAAERDMAAYLATFTCDFGQGRNIKGGETEILLPGGNDMIPLYTQYTSLAKELKTTKEALGLKPGIESETIIEKANAGLYDNASIGKTGGAFTSLSRALSDPNSKDAAAWAAQKSDAADKTKTGMITAAAGIGIGAIGNLALNATGDSGKNIFGQTVAKNKADEINEKYAKIAAAAKEAKEKIENTPKSQEPCGGDATGMYPNCDCGKDKIYVSENNSCVPRPQPIDCGDPTELVFVTNDNQCGCRFGYDYVAMPTKGCVCNKPKNELEGRCQTTPIAAISSLPATVSTSLSNKLPPFQPLLTEQQTKNLFDLPSATFNSNKSNVLDPFRKHVTDFAAKIKDQTNFSGCYIITGHTDMTGSKDINDRLSTQRAEAVAELLTDNGVPSTAVKSIGKGWAECTTKEICKTMACNPKIFPSDDSCRRTSIEIIDEPCSKI